MSGVAAPFADAAGTASGSGDAGAGAYGPSSILHATAMVAGAPVASIPVSGSDGITVGLAGSASGSAAGSGDASAVASSLADAAGSASGSGDALGVPSQISYADSDGTASGSGDAGGVPSALYGPSQIARFTAAIADAPLAAVPVSGEFGVILTTADAAGSASGSGISAAAGDFDITPIGAGQVHAHDTYMYPGGGGAPSPPSSYERKKRRRKPRVINATPKPLATGLDLTTTVISKPKAPDYINIDRVIERLTAQHAPAADADDDDEVMALIFELAA